MAGVWAERTPPEEMYRRVRGWNGLKPPAQGALRALAGWRERESLRANRPPSFLMNDRSLLEIARRRPRDEAALRDVRGLGAGTVQRHGRAILRWIEEGSADPPEAPPPPDIPPPNPPNPPPPKPPPPPKRPPRPEDNKNKRIHGWRITTGIIIIMNMIPKIFWAKESSRRWRERRCPCCIESPVIWTPASLAMIRAKDNVPVNIPRFISP